MAKPEEMNRLKFFSRRDPPGRRGGDAERGRGLRRMGVDIEPRSDAAPADHQPGSAAKFHARYFIAAIKKGRTEEGEAVRPGGGNLSNGSTNKGCAKAAV